ncbi:hypothetical protein ASE00_07755 [Sphingomonas sp. Root710]|uniref:hypothetical protein n=1 Tax=Sphingomonas sp. Root710 TaxID=1736594 RepID=UPI000700417A|nr:hypothetical protein [Sphingomonas sp. Root710]KRB86575.1 hypothetical protein ASE00_07755 [Sphingomonas sp. Root710]
MIGSRLAATGALYSLMVGATVPAAAESWGFDARPGPLLPVGQAVDAQAGIGDVKGPMGIRMACYELPFESDRAYRITVRVDRASSGAWVADGCENSATVLKDSNADAQADKLILYRTHDLGNRARFLRVNLWGRGKPYRVMLELVASTPSELTAFDAEVLRAEEARVLARQRMAQQRASRSDSGLFGALAMGVGAALGGGNAEQVAGFAMKGAELTSDDANMRSALAGQADSLIASGTQHMMDKNKYRSGASPSGTPVQAPTIDVGSQTKLASSGSSPSAQQPGITMYGFCWASVTDAGDSPIYHSQVGRTDRYLNGATADFPNDSWIHRMEREFAGQIGAHAGLICYENASSSGFDYTISMNSQGHPIIQVPWRPY